MQKQYRGVSDPDQAYILNELIRYLSDPRSGAVAFDSMGSGWPAVRDGAREHTLRKGDPNVDSVVLRWDELVRYLCLDLTRDLGRDVSQILSLAEKKSPLARQQTLRDALVGEGRLSAELKVPDAAGTIRVIADLRARQVRISTSLAAPAEGRSKGKVSWLLRQLSTAPDALTVEARVPRAAAGAVATLSKVREQPDILYSEHSKDIREFILTLTRDMGQKRDAGRGSFIQSVVSTAKEFYAAVLQDLAQWKPKAPRFVPHAEEPTAQEIAVELPESVADGVAAALQEQSEMAEHRVDAAEPGESQSN